MSRCVQPLAPLGSLNGLGVSSRAWLLRMILVYRAHRRAVVGFSTLWIEPLQTGRRLPRIHPSKCIVFGCGPTAMATAAAAGCRKVRPDCLDTVCKPQPPAPPAPPVLCDQLSSGLPAKNIAKLDVFQ